MNLGAALDPLLDQRSQKLVAAFFDPHKGFAGMTFDGLGRNRPGIDAVGARNQFTPSDLLAVTLLDVRFTPPAVRSLLVQPDSRILEALGRVPSSDIWADAIIDQDFDAADELYAALCALPGVKRTRATKLMARKRPRFVPIVDSVILGALQLPSTQWQFQLWREALIDSDRRARVEALRPLDIDVPLLRIVDVLFWMRFSRSRAALREREVAGL